MTLSPKARELIEASRTALRPSAADRNRIEGVLRARLGEAALPGAAGVAHAAKSASWQGVTGVVAGVCVVAGATLFVLRDAPAGPTAAPAQRPPLVEPAAPVPSRAELPPPAAGAPALAPPPVPRGVRARDRLAQEVGLLSRAATELRAGRAAAALAALDEHARKFPAGTLREERHAARAQALCALGRMREGLAELERLDPRSPTAAHARHLCEPPR